MLKEFELASIMSRPDLPQIAESIVSALRTEQERRARFRAELMPDVKAEFIAGEVVFHSPANAKHLRATEKLLRLLSTYVQVVCRRRFSHSSYRPVRCSTNSGRVAKAVERILVLLAY